MATTTIQTNNKLVIFTRDIIREWVRENLFSPYMGEELTAIIRLRYEPKKGGEQMNIPLVTRLQSKGRGKGTLVGNEERIDNYGMRAWVDWVRNAVKTDKSENQKDSADVFGEAKPLLSDWAKELQRDEIIMAMMALPTESPPAGLSSDDGQRVNGILFESSTAAQRNTWNADNSDRVLYGATTGNYVATFATALANVGPSPTDDLIAATVSLAKYVAKQANPKIRPFKVTDGREYFVMFSGSLAFRDLKISLQTVNKDARPREGSMSNGAPNNPIFQDGDQIYDGVIVREVPEIDGIVTDYWPIFLTGGAGGIRANPNFLCGQAALAIPMAQMPSPTFLKEDDYGFLDGAGIEMCYGVAKIFKKHPMDGTALKQWGMVTVFTSNSAT
jgi:hypothetical protein